MNVDGRFLQIKVLGQKTTPMVVMLVVQVFILLMKMVSLHQAMVEVE